jgi:hypothetical protein
MLNVVFDPLGVDNLLRLIKVFEVVVVFVLITLVKAGTTGAGETIRVV